MTGRARITLIAALFAGACAPAKKPTTAPEPAPDSVSAAVPAAMELLEDKKAAEPRPAARTPRPETREAPPRAATREAPRETPPEVPAPPPVRASAGTVAPMLESADAPPWIPPTVSWDIEVKPYLTNDRVEFYVRRFTGSSRSTIVSWMERGRKYEPMIRKVFREHGIAEDMYYLGLVESGYDPHAYSRAAAVGMWQFMTATAKGVGLRVDWWVDERRDPMRSTRAAARFLRHLNEQFGSLYLAAAAYNGGPARISRGLNRYEDKIGDSEGDDQFFALAETRALRSETSNYVPQLIAAAAIGKEPWKYGITLDSVAPYAYDSVLVPPRTAVGAVGLVTGAHIDSLRDHNPHLLRGSSPPDKEAWVRVPVGSATATSSADLLALPDSVRSAWMTVKARKATTIATMSKAYGLTQNQLRWYNPKIKGTRIPAGTSVNIPTKLAVSGAFAVADPSVERYGTAVNGVVIVRKGQTLSHIAARNNTTVARLMALNGLKKNVIYPGQAIRVRASAPRKR